MKQILQDMAKGGSTIVDAPVPKVSKASVLINSSVSLISAGTERMLVNFGRASLLDKARQQPDKVKMVLEKIKTDGLMTTVDAVRSKLSQPLPLGYCNVGVVVEAGLEAGDFKIGDRVISNGPHADVVNVSKNLCASIPPGVTDEEAAFTVIASIGLQGIRLAQPSLGEAFAVTGVGLIGLLTVQLLRAHGCRVLAIDYDDSKLKLAKEFGAEVCNPGKGEDPVVAGHAFSRGKGIDGVIITASTTTSDPVTQAARMSRKRGRIILVGVTGLELNRADFYEKELSFQVSCSYGPGRYDPIYEGKGIDYPYGLVRWTQQRNFEAILDMMASGQLNVKPLISHVFDFEKAVDAYDLLSDDKSALGILLKYNSPVAHRHVTNVELSNTTKIILEHKPSRPSVGFIGAGNYASRMLIPAFKAAGVDFHSISTSGGVSGVIHGSRAGFAKATTDTEGMIQNPEINVIAIVTRHNTHADLVCDVLKAGKHVFVEKPLAITKIELERVESIYNSSINEEIPLKLMVGFNRRFAPQIIKIKKLIEPIKQPKSFIMTINSGAIPAEHWTQDNAVGGGRIIGEACHFIDLMRHLADSEIISVQARKMGDKGTGEITDDKAAIILGFADGSFGTINYLANGSASFPKERIEIFTAGRVLQLDNFRKLKGFGWPGFSKMNLWKQDKGQNACVHAFVKSIENGGPSPISASELFEVARVSIEVVEQLRSQK